MNRKDEPTHEPNGAPQPDVEQAKTGETAPHANSAHESSSKESSAQEASAQNADIAAGPAIGLALGGGVARGWAHIGVLRRLDELNIRPSVVAGTSIGALVGGYWLAGKLDDLEEWARALNKRRLIGNLDLMINGAGLIGGRRLRQAMVDSLGEARIEDLPTRFIAVTAELSSGHERWIRNGTIIDAVEAAYALPGVFPPRMIDGKWLIDGALVNPLPVSVCRAYDAEFVLAVGLHADAFFRASAARKDRYETGPLIDAGELEDASRGVKFAEKVVLRRIFRQNDSTPGLGAAMVASFNIVMDRITRSRLAGDPPDVQIMPQAGHIGLFDFDRADELIELGREAVNYALPRIEGALNR